MVDAADLKSAVRKDVPVRVGPWAPGFVRPARIAGALVPPRMQARTKLARSRPLTCVFPLSDSARAAARATLEAMEPLWQALDASPETGDAKHTARLELARACLEAANQLVVLAAALLRSAERDAHRDLAIKVETWLSALSQRARDLHQ